MLKGADTKNKIKRYLDILAAQMFNVPHDDSIVSFEKDTDEVLSMRYISFGFDAFHDAGSFLASLNSLLQRPEIQKKIRNSLSIYHVSADVDKAYPLSPEALGRQCLETIGCQDQPWAIFWHSLSHSCHIHILVYRLIEGKVLHPRAWPLNDLKARFGNSDISMSREMFREKVIRVIHRIQACDRDKLDWKVFNDLMAEEGLVLHPDPAVNGGARLNCWSANVPGIELTSSLSMDGVQAFLGPYPVMEPRQSLASVPEFEQPAPACNAETSENRNIQTEENSPMPEGTEYSTQGQQDRHND